MNWFLKFFQSKSNQEHKNSIFLENQNSVFQAHQILSQGGGTIKALKFLSSLPNAQSDEIAQEMQSIAYGNQDQLTSSWDNDFLDSVLCQCNICNSNWLIPPRDSIPDTIEPQLSVLGVECEACGRVLCSQCVKISGIYCSCGEKYSVIRSPNGRKRATPKVSSKEKYSRLKDTVEVVQKDAPFIFLYYGHSGRIPVALDTSLNLQMTETVDDHLRWAETLTDAGCYFQAQQQLDLIGPEEMGMGKAHWIRARLKFVQYQNSKRRSQTQGYEFLLFDRDNAIENVKEHLEESVKLQPDLGGAWLFAARIYSDARYGADYRRALECVRQAESLLGAISEISLIKGKVLREMGEHTAALDALALISPTFKDIKLAQKEQEIAELELQYINDPADAESVLKLGRLYIRAGKKDEAKGLFSQLIDLRPDNAVGYYGLAKLTFIHSELTIVDKYNKVYNLCQEALKRNPDFGLVYELLGNVYRNFSYTKQEGLQFEIKEPVDFYRRAIKLDASCDTALWILGEEYIKQGDLPQALKMLERAADIETNASSVYFLLATIYMGQRNYQKQEWAYRKAKELSPNTELSADYEQSILKLCGFEY